MTTRIEIGQYRNLKCKVGAPYISPQETVFDLAAWPVGDPGNANDYATDCEEPESMARSEMVAFVFARENEYLEADTWRMVFRRPDDSIMYQASYAIIAGDWQWNAVWGAVGKFPHEINAPGNYYIEINTIKLGNWRVDYTVIDTGQVLVSDVNAFDRGDGSVEVWWNQDIAGTVKITRDNQTVKTVAGIAGTNSATISGNTAGQHTFCVGVA